jgi:hypothetical protein
MLGNSLVSERLLASQQVFCFMELVSWLSRCGLKYFIMNKHRQNITVEFYVVYKKIFTTYFVHYLVVIRLKCDQVLFHIVYFNSLGRCDRGFESHSGYGCLVCVCVYSVFRQRSCDDLITLPRSPTVCEKLLRNWRRGRGPEWTGRAIEKK